MPDYCYALHDFVPEHEDEIAFHAGDRIEVIEKDDMYGDGWWQGRNLFGKIGLFPQSYTTSDPSALQQLDPDSNAPSDTPQANGQGAAQRTELQTLNEESEAGSIAEPKQSAGGENGVESEELKEDGHSRVMRATLTDVQEAIEQLGRKNRDGDGGNSFSFASSRDGDNTDRETDTDAEADEQDGFGSDADGARHKGTRTNLAEKARLQQQQAALAPAAEITIRTSAPPIAVEMSDESEDEDEDEDNRKLGTLYPRRDHAYLPEVNEEDEDSTRQINGDSSRSKSRSPTSNFTSTKQASPSIDRSLESIPKPTDEYIVPDRDDTDVQTATAKQSTFPIPFHPASVGLKPLTDSATASPLQSSQSLPAPPLSPSSPKLPKSAKTDLKQSVSLSRLKPDPDFKSMAPALPSPPPSQNGTMSSMSRPLMSASQTATVPTTHPSEWTVDEVVEWARSKNFDSSVCDKFIEHEISGDVLLDLDVNLLKSELEIVAFGKRMRIANAIAELRRPPSIISEHTQAPSHSLAHSHSQSQSISVPDSANPSLHNPYSSVLSAESPPHTGDIVASPAMPQDSRRDSDPGSSRHHSSLTSGSRSTDRERNGSTTGNPSSGVGLGFIPNSSSPLGSSERLDPKSYKNRPAYLNLSPSDTALRGKKSAKFVADREEEEDGSTLSDADSASAMDSRMRRPFFGQSSELAQFESKENGSRNSNENQTPVSSLPGSPSTRRTSMDDQSTARSTARQRKRSVDATKVTERHSIFGGTFPSLGSKSRKPAPRVTSSYAHDDIATEKHGRGFSRLTFGGGNSRKTSLKSSEDGDSSPRKAEGNQNLLRKRSQVDVPNGLDPLVAGQSVLEQIGEPDHNGWMRKKGERYNTWKLRYFVLKGPHLYYLASSSKTETKIKGYINISGYKVIVDENINPGKYGFRLIHDTEKTHFFSSDEQVVIREWMKALMKATIIRDYNKPVISSCNIPTIPLSIAQTMNPAPRPPSPTQRDATQKALRRENPNQLSSRDARILMGLPSGQNGAEMVDSTNAQSNGLFNATIIQAKDSQDSTTTTTSTATSRTTSTANLPPRPARETRRTSVPLMNEPPRVQSELVQWANDYLPERLQLSDDGQQNQVGLALYRLAEAIKGRPNEPPVPDSAFPNSQNDDRLDGLFKLLDFFLDNDVRVGSISINDIRYGKKEKIQHILGCMKNWEERRRNVARSLSRGGAHAGPFMALETARGTAFGHL